MAETNAAPDPLDDLRKALFQQTADFQARCTAEAAEMVRRSQEMTNHYLSHGMSPLPPGSIPPTPPTDPPKSYDDSLVDHQIEQFLADPAIREKVIKALAKKAAPG